jgi:hypothetical protein
MKRSLVFALFAVVVSAAPVHAGVIPNTGAAGGTTDPAWSLLWHQISGGTSSGAEAEASLVTSIPSPPWEPNVSGNNWLGVNATATIPGATPGNGIHSYEYAFTTQVTLAAPQLVTGAIGYDNIFVGGFIDGTFDTTNGIYTPGTQFLDATSLLGPGNENKAGFCRDGDGFLPSSSFPNCTVNFAFNLPAGTFKITFVTQGDGTTDGFILNQQGVSLNVPEPTSLALLGIVGVAGFALSRRKRTVL